MADSALHIARRCYSLYGTLRLTGAAHGIGRSIVLRLAADSFDIAHLLDKTQTTPRDLDCHRTTPPQSLPCGA
ncbi:hypothetical protein B0H10DRAFT_1293714 [Mycena sp. CBHHK59/15]|nr:hypothetical protein B0H10DRAFT_1293714 [Mycena sp. CBHHK59/15]